LDPAGVAVAGQEPRHALLAHRGGRLRGRVVGDERQGDLPVDRGEQPRRCRVVGLQDGAQLRFGALLGGQQPVPVAGQGADLSQQWARQRQRPPVGVLMAEAVGQHERVEDVVLAAGGPVALPGPGRDPGRDRIDEVPAGLQVLNQQAFGAFDRHRQPRPELAQLTVELGQPGDVMAKAGLASPRAGGVDHAQLVVAAAPVDADERILPVGG
jgi:hypothetical protein